MGGQVSAIVFAAITIVAQEGRDEINWIACVVVFKNHDPWKDIGAAAITIFIQQ
jgi:hypothetical protein